MAQRKKVPAKKAQAKKATPAKTIRQPVAMQKLDAFGIAKVCTMLTDGKTMTEVAKAAVVSFGSLQTWLEAVAERSARAREARQRAARLWDEQAIEEIRRAKDSFQLSRAKEVAHHLRWRAAKIAPREYGDKLGIGAAQDLPPLPAPQAAAVNVTFEVQPAEAYAAMLARKG